MTVDDGRTIYTHEHDDSRLIDAELKSIGFLVEIKVATIVPGTIPDTLGRLASEGLNGVNPEEVFKANDRRRYKHFLGEEVDVGPHEPRKDIMLVQSNHLLLSSGINVGIEYAPLAGTDHIPGRMVLDFQGHALSKPEYIEYLKKLIDGSTEPETVELRQELQKAIIRAFKFKRPVEEANKDYLTSGNSELLPENKALVFVLYPEGLREQGVTDQALIEAIFPEGEVTYAVEQIESYGNTFQVPLLTLNQQLAA